MRDTYLQDECGTVQDGVRTSLSVYVALRGLGCPVRLDGYLQSYTHLKGFARQSVVWGHRNVPSSTGYVVLTSLSKREFIKT